MNAVSRELHGAGRRLVAAPAAMFVAVLTAGFALASTAHHLGAYSVQSRRHSNVVLACPRATAAKSVTAGEKTGQTSSANTERSTANSAAAANADLPSQKQTAGKAGGSRLSVPLPDFNAPELSKFISPL